jgi:hypothetical protein
LFLAIVNILHVVVVVVVVVFVGMLMAEFYTLGSSGSSAISIKKSEVKLSP